MRSLVLVLLVLASTNSAARDPSLGFQIIITDTKYCYRRAETIRLISKSVPLVAMHGLFEETRTANLKRIDIMVIVHAIDYIEQHNDVPVATLPDIFLAECLGQRKEPAETFRYLGIF